MWISDVVGRRALRFLLLVCILAIFPAGKRVAADENEQKTSTIVSTSRKSSGPYCGIYCLYTTMKLDDKEINFRKLVKPKYIGSRKGSSLTELKKAAEDNGSYAIPAGKLTSRELGQSAYSIILHVKSEIGSKQYDHYELFLGTENGKAKLLDPPNPVRLVSFAELSPRWDGNGLIVSAEPIDLGAIIAPARKRFIIYAAIALVIILIVHWAKRYLPEGMLNSRGKLLSLSMTQGAIFAIAALLCGMFYHFANDEGLLANANATALIQQAHLGNFIPKVSEKKVHKLLDGDTVFIDARFARDFEAGHLKGAINVPVDANDVEHQKLTADIAKDARIVLYCQSAGCKFDEIVAIKLMADGFYNISIFRGGWNEWVAKNGKPKGVSL
jgi:rhodanese-related sulfurtransferase